MTDDKDNPQQDPELIAGRYQVLEKLGEGGVGVVFKTRDTILDKIVAVKKLRKTSSAQEVMRFQQEARTAGSLKHAHIVEVMDFVFTDDNNLYLVLSYEQGQSLAEIIKQTGALDLDYCLEIFLQIAEGLSHAHRNQVIHRDIKPSNIIVLDIDGETLVKIVDFGLAKALRQDQSLTDSGVGIGSPPYMSPEQIRGDKLVDQRSDVYSFGCLIFEALTGNPPYRGLSAIETINMHLNDLPPTLSQRSMSEFPQDLEEIVATCLMKDPADRYENADAVLSALGSFTAQRHEELQSEVAEKQTPSAPRRKAGSPMVWLALIACLGVAVFTIPALMKTNEAGKTAESVASKQKINKEYDVAAYDDFTYKPEDDRFVDGPGVNNKTLLKLCKTRSIHQLSLKTYKYEPSDLDCLLGEKKLSYVHMEAQDFTLGLLEKIGLLKSLVQLRLTRPESLDFKGLAKLEKLQNLEFFYIEGGKLINDGMSYLPALPNLRYISFAWSDGVTPEVIATLKKHKRLSELNLVGCDISDQGLAVVSDLNINNLILSGTNVSNSGLKHLTKLKSLNQIHLDFQQIEALKPAIEELKSSNPGLRIQIYNG
ncbi:MAG: serine/threonine protein kinase [Candidatus Obscuribacterales bacterium]|nr:serine/threonine protein kinase [Candidatus Obscuribacterales bacterium]